jgi:hypothetical protein
LQVTPQTKLLSTDGKTFPVDQIRPNVWAFFDAVRNSDGLIETHSITFELNIISSNEVKYRDQSEPKIEEPDYSRHIPGEIKFHYQGTVNYPWTLTILPDETVQEYVTKVGEGLIPQYQKDLPAGDPAKINFRFYVVERPSRWKEVLDDASSLPGGVIIVPDNVLAALDNEAQLAALLSNCIAVTLEEQLYAHRARLKAQNVMAWAGVIPSLYGFPLSFGNGIAADRFQQQMNEQASRIGLRYMVRDGYDICEAPFAWSAAANKQAENPRTSSYFPTTFESNVLGDLYLDYAPQDCSHLKTGREAYQRMLSELRADAPKLPKPKNNPKD